MTQMQQPDDIAKSRLTQLFRFLQALDQLRNPVVRIVSEQLWSRWFDDLPKNECVELGRGRASVQDNSEESIAEAEAAEENYFILKARRPNITPCPEPPALLGERLEAGWQDINGNLELRPSDSEGDTQGIADAEIQTAFNKFASDRRLWQEQERPVRAAMHLFEDLYSLRSTIDRESETVELILGDGILKWRYAQGERIDHPVLIQRVQLLFDPSIPEFTIVEADSLPELYSALFRAVPQVGANVLSAARNEVDLGLVHPLAGDMATEFLRRFVGSLSPHGQFVESTADQSKLDSPTISRDPVLYLRRRTLGFSRAIDLVLEDIQHNPETPKSLTAIVGIEPQAAPGEVDAATNTGTLDESPDILFTKPVNAEQLEVARRLDRYGLVLVQGPPGTGKTHTIGNIIGHLLAKGKSVLVTSHTSKALKVLRQQVVEDLQPLCVSVLDDSSAQMSDAIDSISDRLSQSDADSLLRESEKVDNWRRALVQKVRALRADLIVALQDEYCSLVVAGKDYSPSEAARFVGQKVQDAGWIPGDLAAGSPMPLASTQIRELYRTNGIVSQTDEQESSFVLPDISKLLQPPDFERFVAQKTELDLADPQLGVRFWREGDRDATVLSDATQDALASASRLEHASEWELTIASDGQTAGPRRIVWEALLSNIDQVSKLAETAHPFIIEYDPRLPSDVPPDQVRLTCDEIVSHLSSGKKLNLLVLLTKPKWKRIIKSTFVNGKAPIQRKEFAALRHRAALDAARSDLVRRWERQIIAVGGPSLADFAERPEELGRQLAPRVQTLLNWHTDSWLPARERLTMIGLDFEALLESTPLQAGQNAELRRLLQAVSDDFARAASAELTRITLAELNGKLTAQFQYLNALSKSTPSGAVVAELKRAIEDLRPAEFRAAYERAVDLERKQSPLKLRQDLLAKLKAAAPDWAGALESRTGVHGQDKPPGDPNEAWLWRQFDQELDRRAQVDIEALQRELSGRSTELQQLTAKFVEHRAWAAQIERTSHNQRQALQGWKKLMKKVPKGKGIRKPRLLAEARKLMPTCQSAIPVWIMPLSRVVETFDPRSNRFDVIIIDEASQADIMSLAALYLGNEIMVVGDHEQVTPAGIGPKQVEVQKLIDEYLIDIPNANLYDGQTSIYDLAGTSYPGMVSLKEHFRCATTIIQFSNHLSYEGKILPLRDTSNSLTKPHCVAHRVSDGSSDGRINENEARTIASLLVACTEQEEYSNSTFGIISLVGDEQAIRIDQILHQVVPPLEYKRRQIQCGSSAQFQGDERDVMFLDVVDSSPESPPLDMRAEGYLGVFKKRFNVAASRARDQMWVVHSLNPLRDLKPGDIRLRLIRHVEDPNALEVEIEQKQAQAESEFERQVIQALVEAGFDVRPQWKVGGYRIDMVVVSGDKKAAIECDGDRWHPAEKTAEDVARQALLERLGWKQFIRIRGSRYFRSPKDTIHGVIQRLGELGISPQDLHAESAVKLTSEVHERVIRRAAELVRQWEEEGLESILATPTKGRGRKRFTKASPDHVMAGSADGSASKQVQDTPEEPERDSKTGIDPEPPARAEPEADVARIIDKPRFALEAERSVADPATWLSDKGFEIIDKRQFGGNLWVIGGPEIEAGLAELKKQGVKFYFKELGGKATGYRPAWFTIFGSIPQKRL